MAQSLTIKTVFSSSFSKASVLALSWLPDLTMWPFHDIIASSAVWNVYMASLSMLLKNCVTMKTFFYFRQNNAKVFASITRILVIMTAGLLVL